MMTAELDRGLRDDTPEPLLDTAAVLPAPVLDAADCAGAEGECLADAAAKSTGLDNVRCWLLTASDDFAAFRWKFVALPVCCLIRRPLFGSSMAISLALLIKSN
jgi:hypothetical protein